MSSFKLFPRRMVCILAVVANLTFGVGLAQDAKLERRTRKQPADATELAEITERGRIIAAYDQVAWHATDAVQALHPESGTIEMYIGRQTTAGWIVAFGKLTLAKDALLLAYEVIPTQDVNHPRVVVNSPASEERGEWLFIARAIDTTRSKFQSEGRPYNSAVLPSPAGGWYVYFYPGTTSNDVFPTGADVRFHVSADGKAILDKHVMHASYLEFPKLKNGQDEGMWFRTAFLDDLPEDTDAANALMMGGRVGIVACPTFVYQIAPNGSITYMQTTKTFMKNLKNKP